MLNSRTKSFNKTTIAPFTSAQVLLNVDMVGVAQSVGVSTGTTLQSLHGRSAESYALHRKRIFLVLMFTKNKNAKTNITIKALPGTIAVRAQGEMG